MFTLIFRIIKYGFLGAIRSIWLSSATLVIMILALIVMQGLLIFGTITKTALNSLQDKIDISVYFKTDTNEDQILKIKNTLESFSEIKSIEYISREDALLQFKNAHQGDPTISQALDELKDNPLSASLNIKAKDPKDYPVIDTYLKNDSITPFVDKVNFSQNQVVIERLTKIIDTIKKGGIILSFILAAIAILITFSTIRLAIYSNREAIGVMRMVGASNNFIRGPYIAEGIIFGIISGLISVLIFLPLASLASPYIKALIPEMDLSSYLLTNFWSHLGIQLGFGIILGVISSLIAIRRYLKA